MNPGRPATGRVRGSAGRRAAVRAALAAVVVCTLAAPVEGQAGATSALLRSGQSILSATDGADEAGTAEGFTLTGTSVDAAGLTYVGTFTVPAGTGSVQVLRLTMRSASFAGMQLTRGCAGGLSTVTAASTASLGGTRIDAISFVATVGGTRMSFSADSPPSTPFPDEIRLLDVTLTATTIAIGTLSVSSLSTVASAC